MPVITRARNHAKAFFAESKEVASCIEAIAGVAVGLGIGGPAGATMSLASAGVLAAKAWSGIASGISILAKAIEPSGEAQKDRRVTLILLVVNEAYFKALGEVLESQSSEFKSAIIPGGGAEELQDAIERDSMHKLLGGSSQLFLVYEERLKQAVLPDGSILPGREGFAADVTAAAAQILAGFLAREEEPYRTLRTRLQNEILSNLPELLQSTPKETSLPKSRPAEGLPLAPPSSPELPAPVSSSAEVLDLLHQIVANQTRESAAKVQVVDSGPVSAQLNYNKTMFDRAKAELEKGKPTTAQALFDAVASELEKITTPEAINLRARSLGNIGLCLHRVGKDKEAARFFRAGHALAPTHLRLRVNLAIADLTEGHTEAGEKSLRAILREKPDEPDVVELLADSLSRRGILKEALELLLAHPRVSENYYCMLSCVHARNDDYTNALVSAKEGIRQIPHSDYAEFCAGVAIAEEVLGKEGSAIARFRSDSLIRLQAAAEHMERAGRLVRKEESPSMLRLYLSNLCGVYGALNEPAKALKAGEEAAGLGATDHQHLGNLFAAQIALRKTSDAVKTARALRGSEPFVLSITREMHALMGGDQYDAMIATFDEAVKTDPSLADSPALVALRIHAQRLQPDAAGAKVALEAAFARLGRVYHLVLEEAQAKDDSGEYSDAEKAFMEAEQLGTGTDKRISRVLGGLFLYRRRRFADALHRLVAPGEDPLVCGVLVEYMHSLLELKRMPELATLGLRAIKARPFKKGIWELTAWALGQLGRVKEAEKVLRELVQHDPSERNHLELAGLCYRQHATARAITVLESARGRIPTSFLVHANLSGLYFTNKEYRKAFDSAKRAREISPKRKEGHAAMLRLLAAGDRIQLTQKEKEFLQESLTTGNGIKAINMPVKEDGELDLSEMIAALKEQHEEAASRMKQYADRKLPLTVLSRVMGRELIETWFSITHSESFRLYFASGTYEEQGAELKVATQATEIVIDATALMGLQFLGLLPVLSKLYKRIYVATSTQEKFVEELRQLESFAVSPANLGYDNGKVRLTETGEAYHEMKLALLRPIVEFIESDQVSIEGMDETAWSAWQELGKNKVLADWILTPAFLAKSKNCAYYCDEFAMRIIANGRYGVSGFCTQALLRTATNRGIISRAELNRVTIKLVGLNYDYVSITEDMTVSHLRSEKYAKTATTGKILRLLENGNYTDEQSIRILGSIAAHAWFETNGQSTPTRSEWISTCVASLNAAKNRAISLIHLVSAATIPLLDFPEAFSAFCLHLADHPDLSTEERSLVKRMTREVFAAVPVEAMEVSPRLRAAWKAMARWQKLKRALQRPSSQI